MARGARSTARLFLERWASRNDLQPDTFAGGILHTKVSRLEAAHLHGAHGDRLGRTELRHNLAPIVPARDRPGLT